MTNENEANRTEDKDKARLMNEEEERRISYVKKFLNKPSSTMSGENISELPNSHLEIFRLKTNCSPRIAGTYKWKSHEEGYVSRTQLVKENPQHAILISGNLYNEGFRVELTEWDLPISEKLREGKLWGESHEGEDNVFIDSWTYFAYSIGNGDFVIQKDNTTYGPESNRYARRKYVEITPVAITNKTDWCGALAKCTEVGFRGIDELVKFYQIPRQELVKSVSDSVVDQLTALPKEYRPFIDLYLDMLSDKGYLDPRLINRGLILKVGELEHQLKEKETRK